MAREYYSDMVQGPRPRILEKVDDVLWAGTLALLERAINTNLLAEDFPELCTDGGEPYAVDRLTVMQTIAAEIPDLGWPPDDRRVPPTLAVIDLVEFLHRHASKATRRKHHSFFDHDHLRFDREAGRQELLEAANRLLAVRPVVCSSRKSTWARIDPIHSACMRSKRPRRASLSAGSLARSRALARSASTCGSVVPETSALSIARPETPGCPTPRNRA